MEADNVRRSIGLKELGPVAAMLLFPLAPIALWFGLARSGLAAAARRPQPRIVQITGFARVARRLNVQFLDPTTGKTYRDTFLAGRDPLETSPPPGADPTHRGALALIDPTGRPHLLDSTLSYLDLTPEERDRILTGFSRS